MVFSNNTAISGGAINVNSDCSITFIGSQMSTVEFNNNKAIQNGGVMYLETNSGATVKGNMLTKFCNNEAILGGAVYVCNKSDTGAEEDASVRGGR